jgi:hypothetical protein
MMDKTITKYNSNQAGANKEICSLLSREMDKVLSKAESKVWHRAPVWFLEGNPVAGYSVLNDNVQLLFWSGQSFDEPDLDNEGSFKAAQKRYTEADQINLTDLRRWLKKAEEIQWDYKNIVKRKGELIKLK